ncbi:hypothetical protein [Paenibacillus alba]|uniref:Uncharacterized protein n=1 Tax=Paenibacillus alba TaxID=1197127 RepID=A0ABU6G6U3_9BACL|nr:hypothetical protein [Paenibacillus alba]MEC0229364.1 hypothetical protein [Paenibacillus alba]
MLLVGILAVGTLSSSAFAQSSNINEKSLDDRYKNALAAGFSEEDAKFKVAFGDKFRRNTQHLDFRGITPVTDEYVLLNKSEYRQKLLAADKAALLHEIISVTKAYTTGFDELKKKYETEKKKDPSLNKVTYTYPDGSFISVFSKDEIQTNKDNLEPNYTPHHSGPWNSAVDVGNSVIDTNNSWTSTVEWQFSNGTSFSKVKGILYWTSDMGSTSAYTDNTATRTGVDGSESADGIIDFSWSSNGNSPTTTATGWNQYITGWRDVTWKIGGSASASFEASYFGISVSATYNHIFHQYGIIEVEGAGQRYAYAGRYQ